MYEVIIDKLPLGLTTINMGNMLYCNGGKTKSQIIKIIKKG